MSLNSMFGAHPMGLKWAPQIEVSGQNVGTTPPEQFIVDPYLPAAFVDPYDPRGTVLIPAGRFLAAGNAVSINAGTNYKQGLTAVGRTALTLHEGKNLNPIGMSVNAMFRQAGEFMTDGFMPKVRRGFLAEVPMILSVNNSHGTLLGGDRVTGFWGSTTTVSAVPFLHKGKPVKWTTKQLYSAGQGTMNSNITLTSATLPGITPRVTGYWASGGLLLTGLTVTNTFNGTGWIANFSGGTAGASASIVEVMYEYGQDAAQIAGEVFRIRSISDMMLEDSFLRWVELDPHKIDFPPAMQRRQVTVVGLAVAGDPTSGEQPSTVTAGSVYRTLSAPLSLFNPVTVYIQGSVTDINGNTTVYSAGGSGLTNWFQMPVAGTQDQRRYFIGQYHTVDWKTGTITFATNVVPTAVRVTYAYWTDPREGAVAWGMGVVGITDGSSLTGGATSGGTVVVPTNPAGAPAHLNNPDIVGALRVFVH